MLNLNLNVRVVCRDILPGLLTGYYICLERPLLLILLSCYLETCEFMLASAGAERQFYLPKCAVCILGSALDVRLPIALREDLPNHHKRDAVNMRKGDSEFSSERGWLLTTRQERETSLHTSGSP